MVPRWLRRVLGGAQTEQPPDPEPERIEPEPPPPTPLPIPTPEPEPAPPEKEPVDPGPPPAAAAPGRVIHVYADRLEERPGPRQLTPSEALMLASDGPEALRPDRGER